MAITASQLGLILSVACLLSWLTAYVLIIRRSFLDQACGIPAAVLGANLAWEGLLVFYFPTSSPGVKVGYGLWLLADLAILYSCLRWGPADYTNRFIRRWFYLLFALGFFLAIFTEAAFLTVYRDLDGQMLGWILATLNAGLMIAMLLRRGSVRGQSPYIALCCFLGNATGLLQDLVLPPAPPFAPALLHPLATCALTLNAVYFLMVWDQCRLEGIDPRRRL